MKIRGPRTYPWGVPGSTSKSKEVQKHGPGIVCWLDNWEPVNITTEKSKITYKEKSCEGQGEMHCYDQNEWYQLAAESQLKG
jgi:hypothetical protein